MTKTGTQNREYPPEPLLLVAVFTFGNGLRKEMIFDWNHRDTVRKFAAESDAVLRAGGSTLLRPYVKET